MNNFQTILVAVFLAFFAFGVLIFSGLIKMGGGSSSEGLTGKITIWGTFPGSTFTDILEGVKKDNKDLTISYKYKDKATYQEELVEALANGKGPDLFIISPDMIKRNTNFIYKIPFESYPKKVFEESFVDGASDIYLDSQGIIGFPLVVDPLVLYYNKDILSNEGIVSPIKTWDELFELNPILTKRDNAGAVSQSMIALGQYENINNAKDIIVSLLLQNDNSIIERENDEDQDKITFISTLKDNPLKYSVSPIESALKFFLEFSDQTSTAYSWNRSLPDSLDMFTGGKLAFYIGRASELFNIEGINPNLSFDVAQIPQIKDSTLKRTYGEIYAMSVNNKSTNMATAFKVAGLLASGDSANNLSAILSLPPVSRSLLSKKPVDNPYLYTFFNSALISRSWIDPDKTQTNNVFKELIESILSNNLSLSSAISKAQGQLELLVK